VIVYRSTMSSPVDITEPATGFVSEIVRARPLSPLRKIQLAAEILLTYGRVRWSLWRTNVPHTVADIRGRVSDRLDVRTAHLLSVRLGRVVSRTLEPLPADSRCLMRSIVLSGLLARRGVDSTIVIGVQPGPSFAAHAWVEYRGNAVLPSMEDLYARIAEL